MPCEVSPYWAAASLHETAPRGVYQVMSRGLITISFAACLAFAQSQPFTDVPYVPTPEKVVDAMLELAAIQPSDVLIDLGSGDGRIPIAAAKRYGIQATGVEIDPDLVRQSEQNARSQGVSDKVRFAAADLFTFDLHHATIVTMFLTPGVDLRLRPKLLAELKPGTRVVSHRFDMGAWVPVKKVRVDDDQIYLWIIPDRGEIQSPPTVSVPSPQIPFEKLARMFQYDTTAPLNVYEEFHAQPPTISYAGARGPVQATLIAPPRKGKYPAIIFAADYGRRDEFLAEALQLARAPSPALSLLIDAPPERPVGWRRSFNSLVGSDNDRDVHIQAVIDIRRGVDLLSARADVDPARIAYVGHGYGANWGIILASVEPRVCAFVLIAGFPSFTEQMESDDPDWANARNALGTDRFTAYRDSMSSLDPIRYTPYWAGSPVLFQFGRFDTYVTQPMAERLVKSIPRPQKSVFYEAGHSVNHPQAARDRSAFLVRYINSSQ